MHTHTDKNKAAVIITKKPHIQNTPYIIIGQAIQTVNERIHFTSHGDFDFIDNKLIK